MNASSPALPFARLLAAGLSAEIEPVDGTCEADARGRVLLADRAVDDVLLASVAAALPTSPAAVVWFAGQDAASVGAQLERHGFEHGAVEAIDLPEPGSVAVLAATEEAADAHQRLLAQRRPPFRAVAIMPIYNEGDVVERSVAALISQGLDVYVFDHRSTDDSAAALERWVGRGLLKVERFPDDAGYDEAANGEAMVWREILRRVEDIAEMVPADWHLFVNADEFREAPWPDTTLAEGLFEVQQLGYNAVNFELVNFMPTEGDAFVPGEDVREHLHYYEPPGAFDLLQIKAWNSGGVRPDMRSHAGHSVLFEGRRVFPTPFILRHYPIRSVEHGMRKVHGERLTRFDQQERSDGWHVQYDAYAAGAAEFLRDRAECERWDGDTFRARLLARSMRQQTLAASLTGVDPAAGEFVPEQIVHWAARCGIENVTEAELQHAIGALRGGVAVGGVDRISVLATLLASAFEAQATLRADMVAAGALRNVVAQAA